MLKNSNYLDGFFSPRNIYKRSSFYFMANNIIFGSKIGSSLNVFSFKLSQNPNSPHSISFLPSLVHHPPLVPHHIFVNNLQVT